MPAMTPVERMKLIADIGRWIYENTETLSAKVHGRLPMQLAYLYPAIARGDQIECDPDSPIVHLLRGMGEYSDVEPLPPELAAVWEFIDVRTEDGEEG